MAGWSEALLPRQNLERLLGVTLPTPASVDGAKGGGAAAAAADDVSADCSICYAYRLPDPGADAAADGKQQLGAAPDVYCSNAACSKPFHGRCLAEWLQSLRDTTSSFGSLFGRCPYCDTLVSVKLAV